MQRSTNKIFLRIIAGMALLASPAFADREIECEVTSLRYEAPQNLTVCQDRRHTGSGYAACIRVEEERCRDRDSGETFRTTRRYTTWHCVDVSLASDFVQQRCAGH